jgi:hypothetical protein
VPCLQDSVPERVVRRAHLPSLQVSKELEQWHRNIEIPLGSRGFSNQRSSVRTMREILKLLNDRSAGDLADLNDKELDRFEPLCETWRAVAAAERAHRKSRPG